MSNNKYAVFLDIDNTLINGDNLQQRNIDVIEAVRKAGHHVFVNTGRSYASIPVYLFRKIRFDGVVAGIGSYVRYRDEIISNITIPPDLLNQLAGQFLKSGTSCYFEGEHAVFYMHMDPGMVQNPAREIDHKHDFTSTYKGSLITKLTPLIHFSSHEIARLQENFTVIQHDTYAEIAMKGCSKAKGMQIMLDHIGIDRKNSIAIGDSSNDLDMLMSAGISIAMANASDEVKAVSSHITGDVNSAGVAAALEKFLL